MTNYWRTKPDAYSPATIQHEINGIQANVDTQERDRLKPPLPDDKFIDTRTMTMWDRKAPWVSGAGYRPDEVCRCTRGGNICDLRDPNWADRARDLGTEEDFKGLIDAWNIGNRCETSEKPPKPARYPNPLEYLRKEVGLDTSVPGNTPRDWVGYMWLGPTPVPRVQFGLRGCGYHWISRINLGEPETPGPHVFHNTLYDKDPQAYFAHDDPEASRVGQLLVAARGAMMCRARVAGDALKGIVDYRPAVRRGRVSGEAGLARPPPR